MDAITNVNFLCYEPYSARWFMADPQFLAMVNLALNESLARYKKVTLEDYYKLLGLPAATEDEVSIIGDLDPTAYKCKLVTKLKGDEGIEVTIGIEPV